MLNRFVWETYLKSGGNDVVEMFRKNLVEEYSEDYAKQIRSMVARYCPMDSVLNELEERLMQLCLSESIETVAQGQDFPEQQQTNSDTSLSGEENLEEYDIIDALMDDEYDHLYGMLQEEYQAEPRPQDVFCAFISHLVESSTLDAMDYPEYFVPYYFPFSFNVLQIIAEKFEIMEKAEVLAKAAGLTLGSIQTVDYSWGEINLEVRPMDDMLMPSAGFTASIPSDLAASPPSWAPFISVKS